MLKLGKIGGETMGFWDSLNNHLNESAKARDKLVQEYSSYSKSSLIYELKQLLDKYRSSIRRNAVGTAIDLFNAPPEEKMKYAAIMKLLQDKHNMRSADAIKEAERF